MQLLSLHCIASQFANRQIQSLRSRLSCGTACMCTPSHMCLHHILAVLT